MKMAEAVASMEVVEASGSNEADVDVRFDLADWKLEMGENDNDDQSEGEPNLQKSRKEFEFEWQLGHKVKIGLRMLICSL